MSTLPNESYFDNGQIRYQPKYVEQCLEGIVKELAGEKNAKTILLKEQERVKNILKELAKEGILIEYKKNYIDENLENKVRENFVEPKATELLGITLLNIAYIYFCKIDFNLKNKTITWPDDKKIIDGAEETFGDYFGFSKKERQGITFTGIENTRRFIGFIMGEGIDYSQSLPNIWQQALDRFRKSPIINYVLGKELVGLTINESGIKPQPNAKINKAGGNSINKG